MSATLAPGTPVGEYRVTGLLAQGGMATVYVAERPGGGRVALKVLRPELAGDPSMRERFVREARYTAAVEHPGLTRVYGSGEAAGLLYLALEYVEGTDLRALLTVEHRLEPRWALELLAQVARALDAAHAHGILHRDVKPGNILVASGAGEHRAGRAVLTDLGLSKEPGADASALTVPGDFVGTTQYTAPEQILGRRSDHRADVYSLGCVLYECLVGEPPFAAAVEQEVLYGHLQEPPPRPSERRDGLPAALDEVIARALAKDPEARFGSCSGLIASAWAAIVPPVLRLRVTDGNAAGTEIEVADDLVIGRHAEEEEGRLANDAEISRMRARISRDDAGRYAIADLGSTNGTFLNGRRIDGLEPLAPGDVVELGATTLVVDAAEAGPPEPESGEGTAGAGETVFATQPPLPRPVAETMLADTPIPAPSVPPPAPAPPPPAAVPPPPPPEPEPDAPEPVVDEAAAEEAPAVEAEPAPAPAAAEAQPEPAAAPRLSLRLDVDWEAREVSVGFDDEPGRISLVHEDGRWRIVPSS